MQIRLAIILALCAPCFGQLYSGVIDPTRASANWPNVGVTGGIPTRTTICTTISLGASLATVNAAISACPAGQVVSLPAGTFTFASSVGLKTNNVTIRGAGADQTFLKFTGTGSCGYDGALCVENAENASDNPQNVMGWTAGYAQGATTITISGVVTGSLSNLHVGDFVTLDQLNDADSDNGQVWACDDEVSGGCATEGGEGITRAERSQGQQVIVTQCDGNTTTGHVCASGTNITISPGLYMPNWNDTTHGTNPRTPQAWWSAEVSGVGIEDLSIDSTNSGSEFGIVFLNAHDSWVRDVRSMNTGRAHMFGEVSARITVRDSYLYGTQNASSTSYGFETDASGDWLEENNIFQKVTGPVNWGKQASGSVAGYGYAVDDYYTNGGIDSSTLQAMAYHHASGMNYILFEGNIGTGATSDAIHGTQHFRTDFRNRYFGWEPNKSGNTNAINIYAFNRYFNQIGNVLGTTGFHTQYECFPTTATSNCTNPDLDIFMLGFSGNSAYCNPSCTGAGFGINDDYNISSSAPGVRGTMMRWGNWDVVNNATRFVSGEVPSGISLYSNAVPGNTNLPASFYHATQPTAWWKVGSTTPPWPLIGPDVSSGNLINSGGHANANPAQLCFDSLGPDSNYSSGNTATISTITQSGTTVTVTASGTLPAAFVEGRVVNLAGSSVAAYNSNWQMTSVSTGSFQFTAASGLGSATGGTATASTVMSFNANSCYSSALTMPSAPCAVCTLADSSPVLEKRSK